MTTLFSFVLIIQKQTYIRSIMICTKTSTVKQLSTMVWKLSRIPWCSKATSKNVKNAVFSPGKDAYCKSRDNFMMSTVNTLMLTLPFLMYCSNGHSLGSWTCMGQTHTSPHYTCMHKVWSSLQTDVLGTENWDVVCHLFSQCWPVFQGRGHFISTCTLAVLHQRENFG